MTGENWIAVYTRPGWERKVAESLEKKGIEHFCPYNKVESDWYGKRKIAYKPLFTSYVFLKPGVNDAAVILRIEGVVNFLYWLNRPAAIPDEEIAMIKNLLNQYSYLTVVRNGLAGSKENIAVADTPVIKRKGNVLEVVSNTIRAKLPSLGYTLIGEAKKEYTQQFTSITDNKEGISADYPTV